MIEKKKVIRVVVAAVAVTVFDMVTGGLLCGWLFNWVYRIEPVNVWKSMSGPPGVDFTLRNFGLNLIFVTSYAILRNGLPGKNRFVKGMALGLFVWALGILPGMNSMYSFMTVAPAVLAYWTIIGFFQAPLEGLIVSSIYGE